MRLSVVKGGIRGVVGGVSAGARELEAPPPGLGLGPLPRKFLIFLHKNGVFWRTLEHGFKLNHVPARSCADN